MKVPFFTKSKKGEGEAHLGSMASTGSSSGLSGSLSSSGSLRAESKERKKEAKLRKSGSFSSSLKERTGKLWSFGSQRQVARSSSEVVKVAREEASGVLTRELSETFRYFDKNGDGKISAAELGEVLRALGIKSTDEELDAMVREVDCDKDGFIDVQEFVQLNKLVSEATEGEDDETKFMQEAFHVFDIDGDGYICAGELYRVLSGLGEAGLTVEQCGTMIQNVDKDGNGLVDFSEFKCLMQDTRVC
ncbi:hypothetical protein KC19_5G081900 [Ceratodon purpureus]|uniref:EF-hand domain-containing protein n=1 Tax=Ceratodon purpureus TaxID=3225 RepID=A0A8T0HZ54_CERPU|nr:hypothetical protein KC19_5G081900 [Ceratodon purpureus]